MNQKMNGLYLAGLILAFAGAALVLTAIAVGYLVDIDLGAAVGAGAALCAFVGIVLTFFSKPKPQKLPEAVDTEAE